MRRGRINREKSERKNLRGRGEKEEKRKRGEMKPFEALTKKKRTRLKKENREHCGKQQEHLVIIKKNTQSTILQLYVQIQSLLVY